MEKSKQIKQFNEFIAICNISIKDIAEWTGHTPWYIQQVLYHEGNSRAWQKCVDKIQEYMQKRKEEIRKYI